MTRDLICIVCPKGCQLVVELDENEKIVSVAGHTCKRGADYAAAECTSPMRTVTSTVAVEDGGVVAVKTSRAVPKEKMLECMKEINCAVACADAQIGDVVICNVAGTKANVVITGKAKRKM